MPKLIVAAILALATLFAALPAAAVETGTPAWLIRDAVLFEGPGTIYDVVGNGSGESRISVERCSKRWCRIRTSGDHGWVSMDDISFGQEPRGPFTGPRLNYPSGGPGTVCFYEGEHFTGASFCARTGFVMRDLLLYERDNRISSISIEGNVSVLVCRDRHFVNYCERVIESQPAIHGFLNNHVSSLHVY
jgi:uncharacterized protein YraI